MKIRYSLVLKQDGTLRPGDRLVSVNGESMEGITKEHALRILTQLKLKSDNFLPNRKLRVVFLSLDQILKNTKLHMVEKATEYCLQQHHQQCRHLLENTSQWVV